MLMRRHYPHIPMLFVSAVACEGAMGLQGECLVKPVLPRELAEKVKRMVERVEGVEGGRATTDRSIA
jgi:hypothetical protein